jgi:SAM-dependent methyltransferase
MARAARGGLEKLYGELASWWPLLSPPEHYAEEAAIYRDLLVAACAERPRTLLELGSGGGNNASHLKASFAMTLVDRAPGMIDVSRALNPECEHVLGDMRDVRLGSTFDAVFAHDAVAYMTTLADLARAVRSAFVHCRPGGAALFAPDAVRETFRPSTHAGGHDGVTRSLRYLEWIWDPDPQDSTYVVDFAYLLRDGDGVPRAVHDRHVAGLFARDEWLDVLRDAGFDPRSVPFVLGDVPAGTCEVFVARRPGR